VTIPAGRKTATINIAVNADTIIEATETIILDLTADPAYRLDVKPTRVTAAVNLKNALAVGLLHTLGFDAVGSNWHYNGKISGVASAADAAVNDNLDGTSNWDVVVTPTDPDITGLEVKINWEEQAGGVFLDSVVQHAGGVTATIIADNLKVTPPILSGPTTGTSNVHITLAGIPGQLDGTANSATTINGLKAVTVPEGAFNATEITMSIAFNANGTISSGGQSFVIALKETDTFTFWAVDGVGIVKFSLTDSESATVNGVKHTAKGSGTFDLVSHTYIAP
jgi:hypothetical protein